MQQAEYYAKSNWNLLLTLELERVFVTSQPQTCYQKNGLNKTYHCRIANFPRCVQREDYRRTGEINSRFLEATGNDSRRYATWDRWFLILEKMLVVIVFTPCKPCQNTATRNGRCGIGDVATETVAGYCSLSKY